jgi:hypothetical protein
LIEAAAARTMHAEYIALSTAMKSLIYTSQADPRGKLYLDQHQMKVMPLLDPNKIIKHVFF